ncbi:NACHT domain-containing protein [Actinoplanes friuliensis]|uniref:Signal transduction protein with Nacht domain n=1 Tax=Actinoplanes friuliensis DSM 7358 TaxID=1246995 RepID=U5W726_9ACTN|nr:signal transduction protein with Nacht domain [Actinoplanes friuliensis]AGZ44944.1 signal transduction protein with Nacht domain [Actinoplanes friuliensis DSM 7358]
MSGSPYTLETAREILAGQRSPVVKALDKLLGYGILAAGPLGLATGHPWLLAAWQWVDQKNELMVHLDGLVATGRKKLGKATGRRRHELLAATHTALVTAAFFEALQAIAGPATGDLSDDDRRRLVGEPGTDQLFHDAVEQLLAVEIDLPWAGSGFDATVHSSIRPYYMTLAHRTLSWMSNFAAWTERFGTGTGPRPLHAQIVEHAVERYRAEYLALAAEVPEFHIWTVMGEHSAAQNALGRLEELVGGLVAAPRTRADAARDTLAALNRGVLGRPVVEADGLTAVRSPTVDRGYVEPHFRWAVMDRRSQPSREDWWSLQPEGTDLAGFLAAHFASPRAATLPLVVLGHPGAGKSLLTRVCAARLSTDAFTTVRIPLRDAPAGRIYRQVEDVLTETTHGKVEWRQLCEASKKRVRVLLIDGLDELMQATGATESNYLRDVADFQRAELEMDSPVAALVTSRTVVADTATIPQGCLVVKLMDFTDEQIDTWVQRWTEANAVAIREGHVRRIYPGALRTHDELARQPLLLLLLAMLASEQDLPEGATSAGLYRTLLDKFVARELDRPDVTGDDTNPEQKRRDELWKLGVVAFGMVNRGKQFLHEDDLAEDLRGLSSSRSARPPDPARRVIGRFFFVHTSEAEGGAGGRSYEFLHATFADYLIAHHAARLLREAATSWRTSGESQGWNDDLLFALLSHVVLGGSGSQSIDFFWDITDDPEELGPFLEHLVAAAHYRRRDNQFDSYDPSGRTVVQRIAVYTSNLVRLRVVLKQGPVAVAAFCPDDVEVETWWPAQVRLWEAVLSKTELETTIDYLSLDRSGVPTITWESTEGYYEDTLPWLALDRKNVIRSAAARGLLQPHYYEELIAPVGSDIADAAENLGFALRSHFGGPHIEESFVVEDENHPDLTQLRRLEISVMAKFAADFSYADVVRMIDRVDVEAEIPTLDRALLVVQHPRLLMNVPDMNAVRDEYGLINIMFALARLVPDDGREIFEELIETSEANRGIAETPEGRAVASLPPELGRRLIPELAKSILARQYP